MKNTITFCLRCAFVLLVVLSAFFSAQSQYNPIGYWRFEAGADTLDSSGFGHHITINPDSVHTSNIDGIAGDYLVIHDNSIQPAVSGALDDSAVVDQQMAVEFWFRSPKTFFKGRVRWQNKIEVQFDEFRIYFIVWLQTGTRVLSLNLNGVGTSCPHGIYDGGWHHYVFEYDAKSGEQRIFIDGNSPQDHGYSIVHGSSDPVDNGGTFQFSMPNAGYRMIGHFDEFAVYDTIIPPTLVWQHYQEGFSGNGFSFADTTTTLPSFPEPVGQGEVNLLEFGPGYPNVTDSVIDLLRGYPLPRYYPNREIRRLIPWLSDPHTMVEGTGYGDRGPRMVKMIEELEHNWNYYLYSGIVKDNYGYVRYLAVNNLTFQPNFWAYHLVNMLNDPANAGKPRFMISNWGQSQPTHLESGRSNFAYINSQTLADDSFYVRDVNLVKVGSFWRKNFAMANPQYGNDYRLDSIGYDGLVGEMYLDSFFTKINIPYVDMIGENDETQWIYSWGFINQDAEILADMAANGYNQPDFRRYQAERLTTMRLRYRDPFKSYVDSINNGVSRPKLEFYWYDLRGLADTLFPRLKPIVAYNDSRQRPGSYLYPTLPVRWRNGGSAYKGVTELVESMWWELLDSEKIFLPAVSPGFNDFFYAVEDKEMFRPAQFLSYLKGLGMLGADSYNLFMYHANSIPTHPRWRIWKPTILSYAQGVSSRFPEYLYQGNVLLADVFPSPQGVGPSRYTFNTGNLQDFITGRQLSGQQKFVLAGSVQRLHNDIAAAPRAKDVCIKLSDTASVTIIPELLFNIRPQGSTYLLDLSGPDTVFYQLDKWHEAKDPWHWCRDFDFEAEVFDSANAVAIRTERPASAAMGDYSVYTSYAELPPSSGLLRYHFTPRHDEQDTLYLWVHARGGANSLQATIGATTVTLTGFPTSSFGWVGSTVPIPGTVHTEQIAELVSFGDTLDIDRVVFKRSPADFETQNFSLSISANDTCFGDTTYFSNASTWPDGCVDHHWNFGDGTFSYEASPWHVYAYPGTYLVRYQVFHSCLDTFATDSILVVVDAPVVNAGPDQIHCNGDSVQLQGTTTAQLFHWRADTAISDTTILNPMALPVTAHWYVLTGTDTVSGCSLSDSLRVTPVAFSISYNDSVYITPGQTVTLAVTGGFYYHWTPDPTLSDTTIWNPKAQPCDTTVYYFETWDACACDTISGAITVFVAPQYVQFLVSDYDSLNCAGDPILVTATGLNPGDSVSWSPNVSIIAQNDSVFTATPLVPTTYTATLVGSGGGCLGSDSIALDVNNCCSTPNLLNLFSPRASTWTLPTVNNSYHIIDTFLIDASISFTGCRLVMDSMAVIWVEPGRTLTLDSCIVQAGCEYMWEGIILEDSTAEVVIVNNSLVRDGLVALRSWYGGELEVESSTFRDNFISIRMDNYAGSLPARIADSRFVSDASTMLPPHDQDIARCGIWVDDIGSVVIGDSTMDPNHFDSLGIGIFGLRSNIHVVNNEFRAIVGNNAPPLDTTYLAQKSAVYLRGIKANPVTQVHTLKVGGTQDSRNIFEGTPHGVEVNFNARLDCSHNYFDQIAENAIYIQDCHIDTCIVSDNQIVDAKFGVRAIFNSHGLVRIHDNSIVSDSSHAGMGINLIGISALRGPSPWDQGAYEVRDNEVDVYGVGIYARTVDDLTVDNNLVDIRGEYPYLDIACGILVAGIDSAVVTDNQVTGYMPLTDTADGIRLEISALSRVKCNQITHFRSCLRFWGNSLGAVVKYNDFQDGWQGLVLENGGNIGQQGNTGQPTGNSWLPTSPDSSWVCGSGVTGRKMALSIGTNPISEDFYVRNTVVQNPDVPQDCNDFQGGGAIPFVNTTGTTAEDCAVSDGDGGGDSGIIQMIANKEIEYPTLEDESQYLASQTALSMMEINPGLYYEDDPLEAFYSELHNGNPGNILNAHGYLLAGELASAGDEIDFTAGNQIETNHQDVIAMLIDLENNDTLSSAALLALDSIARQCPLSGGKAVYQARSLMQRIDPTAEYDNDICYHETSSKREDSDAKEAETLGHELKIWPNPAQDHLVIECKDAVEIQLFDLYGKELGNISHAGGQVTMSVREFSRGLVLIRYRFENGEAGTTKIVLQ